MPKVNYWAVLAAAVTAIVVGAAWYSPVLFGNAWMDLRGIAPGAAGARPPVWELFAELLRSVVIAYVLARFMALQGVTNWKGALRVGAWAWFGFDATLLLGTVIHEHMPLQLYDIHAGHGLVNLLAMALILGVWR
jgi:hypothetical protein